jgi:hypothetical protein
MVGVSKWGLKTCQKVQHDYNAESWTPLKSRFDYDGVPKSGADGGFQ